MDVILSFMPNFFTAFWEIPWSFFILHFHEVFWLDNNFWLIFAAISAQIWQNFTWFKILHYIPNCFQLSWRIDPPSLLTFCYFDFAQWLLSHVRCVLSLNNLLPFVLLSKLSLVKQFAINYCCTKHIEPQYLNIWQVLQWS